MPDENEQLPPSEADEWLRPVVLDYWEKERAIARCDKLLAEIKQMMAGQAEIAPLGGS